MRLRPRQVLGLVLLSASLAAGLAMPFVNPLPHGFPAWLGGGEGSVLLTAPGPAVATRYDAATDTTVVVIDCWYQVCPTAAQVAGDATEAFGGQQIVLFSPAGTPPRGEVDLAEPMRFGDANVTQMTAARFEVGSAYFPLLLYQIAFLGVVVGSMLALGRDDATTLSAALGAGVGVLLGTLMAAEFGGDAAVFPVMFMVLALVVGLVAHVGLRRWGHTRLVTPFFLALAAALLFSQLVATRYFWHGPSV